MKQGAPVAVAYLIWQNPYMAAGRNTFINDMLQRAGFSNVIESTDRYPEVSLNELKDKNCDVLLLSSEPYPFKEKHQEAIGKTYPGMKTFLVDGEMFSWYGSRLLQAPAYFSGLYKEVSKKIHLT